MAQLVEHILGKDEVPGSNPGISYNKRKALRKKCFFVCCNEIRLAASEICSAYEIASL